MPRRRRGAKAPGADAGRGFAMRILLHSPKDVVAGAFAFAAVIAVIANALFLQAGHHPSPMFGSVFAMPSASQLPRPRPFDADVAAFEAKPAEIKPPESKPPESKPADPLANMLKATSAPQTASSNLLRPPAPIPASSRADTIASSGSRRVAAVQRALTEYGYGQLKPTGTVGSDTQAAIQKFERERRIPVTGQMSDRLVRELIAMIGHPID
jgi:Putative peptidoglycan binding domain